MKSIVRTLLPTILCIALESVTVTAGISTRDSLTDREVRILKACEGIVRLFKSSPEMIWPRFDLSRNSSIRYILDTWVLLLNVTTSVYWNTAFEVRLLKFKQGLLNGLWLRCLLFMER